MKLSIGSFLGAVACAAVAVSVSIPAAACTGIRLRAEDGSVIHARTMEFGVELNSSVIIIPRQLAFSGTTPSGQPGLQWSTKYAAVGMNAQGQTIIADGLNEKGLAGGAFYLPGYAEFQKVTPQEESNSLAAWELMTWILTNFAKVDEVRDALPQIKVTAAVPSGWPSAPPIHFIVHDAAENSLVIEYLAGQLSLQNNPIGVITNAPDFRWHMTNLNNYVNLTANNVQAATIDGLHVRAFGQGSGLLGMPGDFTPPSRFVRAASLAGNVVPTATGPQEVRQAFHVLNSFDIPQGSIRAADQKPGDYERTQWTTASDTRSCSFYFHTMNNRRVRKIDLLNADLDATQVTVIPLGDEEDDQKLTPASLSVTVAPGTLFTP